MVELNRDDYSLFTTAEYFNIIGEDLSQKLLDKGSGNQPAYFITYASNLIINYIFEHTGLIIRKVYSELNTDDYDLYLTNNMNINVKLTDNQLKGLKLACIYQADYIIENGSPERMVGVIISGKSSISKKDMKEFEISTMSQNLLTNYGLLYRGIGGGVYERFK